MIYWSACTNLIIVLKYFVHNLALKEKNKHIYKYTIKKTISLRTLAKKY